MLKLDVQTPHYGKYYRGNGKPTNAQNPIPILFMCLGKASLRILVACCDTKLWVRNKEKVDKIMEMLRTVYGIRVKTALGYGVEQGGEEGIRWLQTAGRDEGSCLQPSFF